MYTTIYCNRPIGDIYSTTAEWLYSTLQKVGHVKECVDFIRRHVIVQWIALIWTIAAVIILSPVKHVIQLREITGMIIRSKEFVGVTTHVFRTVIAVMIILKCVKDMRIWHQVAKIHVEQSVQVAVGVIKFAKSMAIVVKIMILFVAAVSIHMSPALGVRILKLVITMLVQLSMTIVHALIQKAVLIVWMNVFMILIVMGFVAVQWSPTNAASVCPQIIEDSLLTAQVNVLAPPWRMSAVFVEAAESQMNVSAQRMGR
jgi:hypothetical protein